MAATFAPAAQKVARLQRGNRQLEDANAALQREAAALEEERTVLLGSLEEQLQAARSRSGGGADGEGAGAGARGGSAEDQRVLQLREELRLCAEAAAAREARWERDAAELKAALERRAEQVLRTGRASAAMAKATDADLGELAGLQAQSRQLGEQAERLEDEGLRARCRCDAWALRLSHAERAALEAEGARQARQSELRATLDAMAAEAHGARTELERVSVDGPRRPEARVGGGCPGAAGDEGARHADGVAVRGGAAARAAVPPGRGAGPRPGRGAGRRPGARAGSGALGPAGPPPGRGARGPRELAGHLRAVPAAAGR
ncbi:unnamed protein product, partial [Prorocentrum cordatum]